MTSREPPPRRGLSIAAVVVVGIALIGLVAGTRESSYTPRVPDGPQAAHSSAEGPAQPARSYTELMTRPWGFMEQHRGAVIAALAAPDRERVLSSDPQAKQAALEARAARRAFTGAPPTIPHPVESGNGGDCLACHAEGGMLGAALVAPMGHVFYQQCTQCHVPERAAVPASDTPFAVVSGFEPLRGAPDPTRWSQAPPQLPHTTRMRERCESCHGTFGRHGLQSSHPERRNCLQCHAPSAALETLPEVR